MRYVSELEMDIYINIYIYLAFPVSVEESKLADLYNKKLSNSQLSQRQFDSFKWDFSVIFQVALPSLLLLKKKKRGQWAGLLFHSSQAPPPLRIKGYSFGFSAHSAHYQGIIFLGQFLKPILVGFIFFPTEISLQFFLLLILKRLQCKIHYFWLPFKYFGVCLKILPKVEYSVFSPPPPFFSCCHFGWFPTEEREHAEFVWPLFTLNINKQPKITRQFRGVPNTEEKDESKEENRSSLEETEITSTIKL